MKVLRAIGAFFAKIGRWIANTAWIQPLLIVGGIFAVIFSIPYIKTAIENAQIDNTDYDYEYYKSFSLNLEEGNRADKLLGYLENEEFDKINSEFGKKFFLAFVQEECAYCKEGVEGFKDFGANFNSWKSDEGWAADEKFSLFTILVDTKDSNDDKKYLAQELISEHVQFFDELAAKFETNSNYALYKNASSQTSGYETKLNNIANSASKSEDIEGIDTPFMLMYDYSKYEEDYFNCSGVTAVVFNYVDLVTAAKEYSETNKATKGFTLRDCWGYRNLFDLNYND
jgi:hypothetical protein